MPDKIWIHKDTKYKAGKYTSDWCLDYEFENGDYKTTFADNPVDACVAMIIKLYELDWL
jgi:hypothetical protein